MIFYYRKKLESRGVIKSLHKKGVSGPEFHNDMVNVQGGSGC